MMVDAANTHRTAKISVIRHVRKYAEFRITKESTPDSQDI
jgi:hypothetical protein